MEKQIANCIRHTHWDLIWYFSVQDAEVQFAYNMREMLDAFDNKELDDFFLDGQTAPIDSFLRLHPEETERVKKYVSTGQLVIGPFNSQLDCFITSGESVLNNLRLGIKTSQQLGKRSHIAYLPDSFGHSFDFPKIFNQFDIKDFVITRGVGDEYNLDSEFTMQSNDGSEIVVFTMIAGYGYGCYAFKNGTLFTDKAVDYNKIDVDALMERVQKYSTLPHDFVFPLGFDQNPMIHGIPELISKYNNKQDKIQFVETTWKDYFEKIRTSGSPLKNHKGELISTQYHRVHRSIYSGRADIKALQDKCERILTYSLQPLMAMLDSQGVLYDHGLLDKAWETLMLCQTHSSANLTDETNNYILQETKNALNLAESHKSYLLKLMSISMKKNNGRQLLVVNSDPKNNNFTINAKIFTQTPTFSLIDQGQNVEFTILNQVRKNNGVLRKDFRQIDEQRYYFETDIVAVLSDCSGISYRNIEIKESDGAKAQRLVSTPNSIENDIYKIGMGEDGIVILDKRTGKSHSQAVWLEDSGDEGDSFDYSYPKYDLVLRSTLDDADVLYKQSNTYSEMVLTGDMPICASLAERKSGQKTAKLKYNIHISLIDHDSLIRIKGTIDNDGQQHRVRFVFPTEQANKKSLAGTQYSIIERPTHSPEEDTWREKGYFEEPSPIYPLLNHVSGVSSDERVTVYTRSSKEYEFTGSQYSDIAVTLFRSYGTLGSPDLNRRPGRPSGLDYMIFDTPASQMKGINLFDLAIEYGTDFDANDVFNQYTQYATDAMTYQNQNFDKSINPIDYFPTNALPFTLPDEYSFIEVKNTKAVFGSLVKADNSSDYGLRLFNASESALLDGQISSPLSIDVGKTDMLFSNVAPFNADKLNLLPGELKNVNIKIITNGGEKND